MFNKFAIIAASGILLTACQMGFDGEEEEVVDDKTPSSSSSSGGASSSSGGSSSSSGGSPNDYSKTSCLATDFADPSTISLSELDLGQKFSLVTDVVFHPNIEGLLYVLQQSGEIWGIDLREASPVATKMLDLKEHSALVYESLNPFVTASCHECGLFSLAFHPDYDDGDRFIYLSYTEGTDPLKSVVKRFRLDENHLTFVKDGEGKPEKNDIFSHNQPTLVRNIGKIRFGSDNHLYIGMGDGGDANAAQSKDSLLGSILRVTADGIAAPENESTTEIHAKGMRNPASFSFDKTDGLLRAVDQGENNAQEINLIADNKNYGWPCYEGSKQDTTCTPVSSEQETAIYEYSLMEGRAIVGGYVYRGSDLSAELTGKYIFGDSVSGAIWSLENQGDEKQLQVLMQSGKPLSGFAKDTKDELYVFDREFTSIYKLGQKAAESALAVPEKLSDTGCFTRTDNSLNVAEKLNRYEIIEPAWSDNGLSEQYFSLPENSKIEISVDGKFRFPVGSVLLKNISLDSKLIETHMLMHQSQGWQGYSYKWNDAQTEAELLQGGEDQELSSQTWHYSGRSECWQCHTSKAEALIGLEIAQINKEAHDVNKSGNNNQLETFADAGHFSKPLSDEQKSLMLVNSHNPNNDNLDVRSFLHANCSHCHRPGGGTQVSLDLRFNTKLVDTGLCDALPKGHYKTASEEDRLVVKGNPEKSILLQRMKASDEYRMPPLRNNLRNQRGIDLISEWIQGEFSCEEIVLLKNTDTEFYLMVENKVLTLVIDERKAALTQWVLEPIDETYFRIRLAGTDLYLHGENEIAEVGEIDFGWESAKWIVENNGDSTQYKNKHLNKYLAVKESQLVFVDADEIGVNWSDSNN